MLVLKHFGIGFQTVSKLKIRVSLKNFSVSLEASLFRTLYSVIGSIFYGYLVFLC